MLKARSQSTAYGRVSGWAYWKNMESPMEEVEKLSKAVDAKQAIKTEEIGRVVKSEVD
jgi:hypothetical protein